MKNKTLKPIKNNIILQGKITKKVSAIIVSEELKDKNDYTLDYLKVFAIGEDVKGLKVGDKVEVLPGVLGNPELMVFPFEDKEGEKEAKDNGDFYLKLTDDGVVGVYK